MTVIDVTSAPAGAEESTQSAVSWGAIIAGAVVAAAVSLVLALLGSGLGLAVVSPWAGEGASATTLAISALVWFVVVQWLASAFGGYVTGRLRTAWVGLRSEEVFFRDTAHGFVAWCLSTLLVAALFSTALTAVVKQGVESGTAVIASATGGAATAAGMSAAQANGVDGYFVDLMLRPATSGGTETATADQRAEVTRILAQGLASGAVPDADRTYLSGLVAARTGLAPAEAAARVDQVLQAVDTARAEAKQAAETARKVGLTTTLLTVVALLVGAFIASVAAAFAGSLRDEDVPAIKG